MIYLSTLLLSVFITVSLIPVMTNLAARLQIVDLPGPRKVHTFPVPRIGGAAMAIGVFIPVLLLVKADVFVWSYIAAAGILVFVGVIDDIKGLGYKAKFAAQIVASLIVMFYGGTRINSLGSLLSPDINLNEWLKIFLTLITIVGVTNAINLADGLDGLAGGISLLSFCCIGYLAFLEGNSQVIFLSLALAGAIFGFLRFNTHPASLFMGDTGSQLLGFSAVVLAVKLTQGDTPLSPLLPLIILGFPVLDTLTVMVERIRQGHSPFVADKSHFHHRLIRFGLSHAEAVFTIYVIQSVLIVSALLFKYQSDWVLMISYAIFSVLVIGAFMVADRAGIHLKRYAAIDDAIRGRLKIIRDNNWTVRISFSVLRIVIPLFLLISCFLPAKVPGYVSVIALCFGLSVLAVRFFAKGHIVNCLRLVLYMTAPLVFWLIQEGTASWVSRTVFNLYNFSFGIIAFFVLLTVRFTRRTKGFRTSTMDFLVIFIAVVVPNLPDHSIQSYHLGFLAVEIIVMLFSYEVLLKELRGKVEALTASTLVALLLIGIRGVFG